MVIDVHIHADTRPYEDFEKMVISGIDTAISCAHDPLRMTSSDVVLDHFYRLMNDEIKRAKENGLKLYIALGIHPRSISPDYEKVLNQLSHLIKEDSVVALGEIGLETVSPEEIDIFKKQLELAEDIKAKVIVHTPRTNKIEVSAKTISIIHESIDPKRVLIDHVDFTIVEDILDDDFILGLTVQPKKMTPEEAMNMLDQYGFQKFMLNSDMSSSPSDPLAVARTVHLLRMNGFKESSIKAVSQENAAVFFSI